MATLIVEKKVKIYRHSSTDFLFLSNIVYCFLFLDVLHCELLKHTFYTALSIINNCVVMDATYLMVSF